MFAGRITNPNGWRMDKSHGHNGRHSPGTVLFPLFIIGLIAYCAIRTCYNVQYEELQGLEAVPHIECIATCLAKLLDCLEGCFSWCHDCLGGEEAPTGYLG